MRIPDNITHFILINVWEVYPEYSISLCQSNESHAGGQIML